MAANGKGKSNRLWLSFSSQGKDSGNICALCHSHHSQLSTPAHWKSEEARCEVLSLQVSLNAFICQPCRQDVTRVLSNKLYVPRWRKGREKRNTCCVMDCTEDVSASLHKTSDQVQSAFEAGELRSCNSEIPVPTPLCKHHYHRVYSSSTTAIAITAIGDRKDQLFRNSSHGNWHLHGQPSEGPQPGIWLWPACG